MWQSTAALLFWHLLTESRIHPTHFPAQPFRTAAVHHLPFFCHYLVLLTAKEWPTGITMAEDGLHTNYGLINLGMKSYSLDQCVADTPALH